VNTNKTERFFFRVLILLTVSAMLFFNGCVRRRMTVRTNPPGATVYLDGKEIGRTPFSSDFDFYGKREFRVVKDGYETKTVILPVRAPWYEWFGIDFFSEVILPGKLTDRKYYEFELQPDVVVPRHELVGRAEELRRLAHAEGVIQPSQAGSIAPPQDNTFNNPMFSPGASIYAPSTVPPAASPSVISQPAVQPPVLQPPTLYSPPRI
jgi:hypothetical protein